MNQSKKLVWLPWLLVFYECAIYLSMDAYAPALPNIAHTFSVSASMAQYTFIAWMLGGFLVQPLLGPISERYGRKPIILSGGIFYILSTLLCAFAPHIDVLLIARFLQGMCLPSMFIPGYAAINELYDTEQAVDILARMNSVTILAPAFGPMLGGALLLVCDWRVIFFILAVWAGFALFLLYLFMPETLAPSKRLTKLHWLSIFKQYGEVALNKKFIRLALMTFLPVVGLITWMVVGPFIVVTKFHHTTLVFGIAQCFIFGSFVVANKCVSYFAKEKHYPLIIRTGLGLTVLGSSLTVATGLVEPNLIFVVISMMVVTFGSGLTTPILSRLTLESSDVIMGVKVGVFSIFRIGSGLVGSVCVTLFYTGSILSMALVLIAFSLMAFGLLIIKPLGD